NCRVSIVDGDDVIPIAFRGILSSRGGHEVEIPRSKVGEGITGHAVGEGKSLLIGNALDCEYAVTIPGTEPLEESLLAVPLNYGSRVIGAIVISKLGRDQFDEDDVRLLEVRGGHAAVALSAMILGAPRTSVWIQDAQTQELVPGAVWGFEPDRRERLLGLRIAPERLGPLAEHAEPFVLDNAEAAAIHGVPELDDGTAFAVAPITLDGGRLCCIVAAIPPDAPHELDEDHVGLLAGLA